jgi:hypothetical protein
MTNHGNPWRVGTAHCGAYDTEVLGGTPAQCGAPVTYAGMRLAGEPVEAWTAFSCDRHRDKLIAARPLLDRDREILDDWRERERRALGGKGWDPPEPLAVGSAARELVRRAWVDAD